MLQVVSQITNRVDLVRAALVLMVLAAQVHTLQPHHLVQARLRRASHPLVATRLRHLLLELPAQPMALLLRHSHPQVRATRPQARRTARPHRRMHRPLARATHRRALHTARPHQRMEARLQVHNIHRRAPITRQHHLRMVLHPHPRNTAQRVPRSRLRRQTSQEDLGNHPQVQASHQLHHSIVLQVPGTARLLLSTMLHHEALVLFKVPSIQGIVQNTRLNLPRRTRISQMYYHHK